MGEFSEVRVPISSPACYTIEDDDEPEVILVSDNDVMSEEDSRDGEPTSTTSDINGHDGTQTVGAASASGGEEYVDIDEGAQDHASELSDSGEEEEDSGNVLNDFIKLIDLVKSYEKVDKTVKSKFKDGFLFLENLQTQFEETEKSINKKDEIIVELMAENSRLQEDNKYLQEKISSQSLQFGLLTNKYVKLEEELEGLKISEKIAEAPVSPVIPVPTNFSLEAMKFKADTLQQLFRELCIKLGEKRVTKTDFESVKKDKELKSFQNEVGVLFIKVQHKLSKWFKNQVNMEEELEGARMALERLNDMVAVSSAMLPPAAKEEMMRATVISGSRLESLASPSTNEDVEPSTNQQPESKKRKLPPPPLVPLNIPSDSAVTEIQLEANNDRPSESVPNKLTTSSSYSPALEPGNDSGRISVIKSTHVKTMSAPTSSASLAMPVQSPPLQLVTLQPSPPPVVLRPSVLTVISSPLPALPMQLSPPSSVAPIKSSPQLFSKSSTVLPQTRTIVNAQISPPPLPPLNFPLTMSPPKPVVSTSTSSSEKVTSPVSTISSVTSQIQPTETKQKTKRRRSKTLKPAPQTTSVESRHPFTPPQYSQTSYPVHPQHNLYSVSQHTPNGTHQATLQAYQNKMMQFSYPTGPQSLPQQQHQITSSVPPVASTQNNISPAFIRETPKNKCQVCGMTFVTIIQLKLHHTVVHSNKTPSSAFTGPATTSVSSPTSSTPSNGPNQKRHCQEGPSQLAFGIPTTSMIPKSAKVAPLPVNHNNIIHSINSTQPRLNDNNFVSWFNNLL